MHLGANTCYLLFRLCASSVRQQRQEGQPFFVFATLSETWKPGLWEQQWAALKPTGFLFQEEQARGCILRRIDLGLNPELHPSWCNWQAPKSFTLPSTDPEGEWRWFVCVMQKFRGL